MVFSAAITHMILLLPTVENTYFFVETMIHFFFRILLWIESSKTAFIINKNLF